MVQHGAWNGTLQSLRPNNQTPVVVYKASDVLFEPCVTLGVDALEVWIQARELHKVAEGQVVLAIKLDAHNLVLQRAGPQETAAKQRKGGVGKEQRS